MRRKKGGKGSKFKSPLLGVSQKELKKTKLGRRILELAKSGRAKDLSLIEDVLIERFSGES